MKVRISSSEWPWKERVAWWWKWSVAARCRWVVFHALRPPGHMATNVLLWLVARINRGTDDVLCFQLIKLGARYGRRPFFVSRRLSEQEISMVAARRNTESIEYDGMALVGPLFGTVFSVDNGVVKVVDVIIDRVG